MKLTDSDTLIDVKKLSRHYRAGEEVVSALDQVSFTVGRGEFVALVGPSGSGKSTLLNLVGALDRPTAGEICVDGLSLGQATEAQRVAHRRQSVGFIFQSFNLLATLSAVENIETPMMLADVSKRNRRQRALSLLESVGLSHRANHKPNQLSGGEKQRIAIARALANRPSLLLADEPTGNLDSKTGAAIIEMLRGLLEHESLTILLVTHDPQVAAQADRIIYLQDGRVCRIENRVQSANNPAGKETP